MAQIAIVVTVAILVLNQFSVTKAPILLAVNAEDLDVEKAITDYDCKI